MLAPAPAYTLCASASAAGASFEVVSGGGGGGRGGAAGSPDEQAVSAAATTPATTPVSLRKTRCLKGCLGSVRNCSGEQLARGDRFQATAGEIGENEGQRRDRPWMAEVHADDAARLGGGHGRPDP